MFEHARRFRGLAALGLVLALVQGRTWAEEPIWTKAVRLVGCIWEPPYVVTAREKPVASVPPGIFAWEKVGAARREFGAGVNSDAGLTGSIALNDRCFSLLSGPTVAGNRAPVLPERKDMLPNSERTKVLVELGVIADVGELLRTSCFTSFYGLGGFLDSD
jgi:hypothetical protein